MYSETPFVNPYVGSIADLILRPAEARAAAIQKAAAAQAQAAQTSGNAYGQAIASSGQQIGAGINALNDPQRQLVQQEIAAKARKQHIDTVTAALQKQAQNPDGTLNRAMFDKLIQSSDLPLSAQADAGKALDSFEDHQNQITLRQKEGIADLGNMLYYATNHLKDEDHDSAVAAIGALANTLPGVQKDEVQPYLDAIAKGANPKQIAVGMMSLSPSKRYEDLTKPIVLAGAARAGASPATAVIPGTGEEIARGANAASEAPKPEANVVYKTPDGVEHPVTVDSSGHFIYNGKDVTADVTRPSPQSSKGLQSENVLYNGKPVQVTFNPETGKRMLMGDDGKEVDVTGKTAPIPPASVQAMTTPLPAVDLNDHEKGIAKDLALGKLTFGDFSRMYSSRGAGQATKEAIYAEARQLNPEFSPAQFEAGYKFATNPQVTQRVVAINALAPVIDSITSLAAQAGNTDIPGINKLLNSAKFQLGGRTITDLKQLQTILGDEVGNALGVGTGSDMKTKLGLDLVNTNLGPANFLSTMQQLQTMLNARRDQLIKGMGVYGSGGAAVPVAPQTAPIKVGGFTVTVKP